MLGSVLLRSQGSTTLQDAGHGAAHAVNPLVPEPVRTVFGRGRTLWQEAPERLRGGPGYVIRGGPAYVIRFTYKEIQMSSNER